MTEPGSGVRLPTGWWRDAEGATAFLDLATDVLTDGSLTDLGWLVEEAGVLTQVGAVDAARAIVVAAAVRWLREVGPGVDGRPTFDGVEAFDSVMRRLASAFEPDVLTVPLGAAIADTYRGYGDLGAAATWYARAAKGASSLGMDARRASYLQSLGAALIKNDEIHAGRVASEDAARVFEQLGDVRGLVEVELNLVQLDLAEDDLDGATDRLRKISDIVRGLRDGHITASFQRLEAMLLIELGNTMDARRKLMLAYRSRMRANDLSLAQVTAQNLAKLTLDAHDARSSIKWWRTASDLADTIRDVEQQVLARRGLATALLEAGEVPDAIKQLRTLVDTLVELGDERESARATADLGAAFLSRGQQNAESYRRGELKTKRPARDAYRRGEAHLLSAFEVLERFRDEEWMGTVSHNLRIAWYVLEAEERGVETLVSAAGRVGEWSPRVAARMLRAAGELAVESDAPTGVDRAANYLLQAAEIEVSAGISNPLKIIADAQRLVAHIAAPEAVLALAGMAEGIAALRGPATLGDVLNDLALIHVEQGDLDRAVELLVRVRDIAEGTSNRVLRARTELNLGETAFRRDDYNTAVEHLALAGGLSKAVGDIEQASLAYSSCANSYLSLGRRDLATKFANDAATLANDSASADAKARAASARASVAFDNGNHSLAYDLWLEAAHNMPAAGRARYRAFALDALAHMGEWRSFNRRLESFARESQRALSQLEFAAELHFSATAWLRAGYTRRAAKVLAYAALLAVDRATQNVEAYRLDESRLPASSLLLGMVGAVVPIRTYLEFDEISDEIRADLRRWFEWYVRRAISDQSEADLALTLILESPIFGANEV